MATPILTISANPLPTIHYNTAQVLDFGVVKDASGSFIDISSGWTGLFAVLFDDRVGGISVAKTGTWTYGSDGKLSLTLTQSESSQFAPGNYLCRVAMSNDGGTTNSTHQGGNFQVVYP